MGGDVFQVDGIAKRGWDVSESSGPFTPSTLTLTPTHPPPSVGEKIFPGDVYINKRVPINPKETVEAGINPANMASGNYG